MAEHLPKHPLTEAIFELQWNPVMVPVEEGTQPQRITIGQSFVQPQDVDPFHKVFLGRVMGLLIAGNYPHMNPLPSASFPDNMAAHVVQYQFWSGEQQWPVVQIGPGILTLNTSAEYTWAEFFERAVGNVDLFFNEHPSVADVRVSKLVLKYTNLISLDPSAQDGFVFLKEMMHTDVQLPAELFDDGRISGGPTGFGLRSTFKMNIPRGLYTTSLQTGYGQNGDPVLVLENQFVSSGTDVSNDRTQITEWLRDAHEVADKSFQAFTRGELERRFQGD